MAMEVESMLGEARNGRNQKEGGPRAMDRGQGAARRSAGHRHGREARADVTGKKQAAMRQR